MKNCICMSNISYMLLLLTIVILLSLVITGSCYLSKKSYITHNHDNLGDHEHEIIIIDGQIVYKPSRPKHPKHPNYGNTQIVNLYNKTTDKIVDSDCPLNQNCNIKLSDPEYKQLLTLLNIDIATYDYHVIGYAVSQKFNRVVH